MTPTTVSSDRPGTTTRVIPTDLEQRRLHLVGIGGCGMSGLAALLLRCGTHISGSDMQESAVLARLTKQGARINARHGTESIPADAELVVASAAIAPGHPELLEAQRRGVPVVKYAELLGAVMARYDGIAISGTHGKSTTTAWLTFVLKRAGLDPSFVVGATVEQLGGGSGVGDGRHFVAEACEYDRSFLNLRPRRAVVLNIEEDHLDCYPDLPAIQEAFAAFIAGVPPDGLVVLNVDDPQCRAIADRTSAKTQTFASAADATWRATALELDRGHYAFDARHGQDSLGRVRLGLPGRHNVTNALAVIAIASDCDVSWDQISAGLAEFRGARRRLELRAEVGDIRIVDDYAHHPTEIRATLEAARERFEPRRLWCVFQPHQHSRTRFLLKDFARSFARADHVVVPDIYFVRDSERDRAAVSAEDLVTEMRARGGDAEYVPGFDAIVTRLEQELAPGDVVLTMGAGDIWKVADELAERLGGHLSD